MTADRKRLPAQQGMVRWSRPSQGWHDTREGGLYVWAVITREDATPPACWVHEDTPLMLGEPDASLYDTSNPGYDRALWRDPSTATHTGDPDTDYPQPSEALAAAVLLGSTPHSWACHPDGGEYFTVRSSRDLTRGGRRLTSLLSRTVGGPVRYLTILDT